MGWLDKIKPAPKGAAETEPQGEESEARQPASTAEWTAGRQMGQRAMSFALLGCLACGPVALAYGLVDSQRPVAVAAAPDVVGGLSETQQRAGYVAVDVVDAWLSATREDHSRLDGYTSLVADADFPATAAEHTDPRLVSIEAGPEASTISVVVAARVQIPSPAGEPAQGQAPSQTPSQAEQWPERFWQVALYESPDGLSVLGLPAEISLQESAAAPDQAYVHDVPRGSQAFETVKMFLNAQLAGSGEIGRYTAPGSQITAVDPAPYVTVRVEGLKADVKPSDDPATGEQTRVSALVYAQTAHDARYPMTVWLTLTARDQRWEVSTVDPVPSLSASSASPTAAPTATSSASPTSAPVPTP